jgi:hypothetical protein
VGKGVRQSLGVTSSGVTNWWQDKKNEYLIAAAAARAITATLFCPPADAESTDAVLAGAGSKVVAERG